MHAIVISQKRFEKQTGTTGGANPSAAWISSGAWAADGCEESSRYKGYDGILKVSQIYRCFFCQESAGKVSML